jgi:hypothetical protein
MIAPNLHWIAIAWVAGLAVFLQLAHTAPVWHWHD